MLRTHSPARERGKTAAQPSEDEEVRLIRRTAGGELRAFEALFRLYHPRVSRFLERVTRRPSLVEELLNDTMLVVWRRADSYNGASKVSTWIFAIAYRKALKALKHHDEPMEDGAADERPGPGPSPEQYLVRDQSRAALARALDDLSAAHRAVIALTYFHDMGYQEISEIVDCPVDTVKTRAFHARRRLKLLLAGSLEDWL
ncbi:MAG: sigma-70 family RNA polymerase sigma factor [Proteobacteria bacterium]|nr:sigma-70 family RNA polymerase sigma factor [Pseudomonadota bacterium]